VRQTVAQVDENKGVVNASTEARAREAAVARVQAMLGFPGDRLDLVAQARLAGAERLADEGPMAMGDRPRPLPPRPAAGGHYPYG